LRSQHSTLTFPRASPFSSEKLSARFAEWQKQNQPNGSSRSCGKQPISYGGNLDAAEYKHVVLGLIFLKYISDAFEEKHRQLSAEQAKTGANPEDRDEYLAENIFWVPPEARWSYLLRRAKDPLIGKLIDNAMIAIERDNASLKNTLPKDYARPHLDKQRLGELIDLIGKIGLGDRESRSKDILGSVYEYFLSQFASAEGKKGGQFYTPRPVVRLLVEMLAPYKGRVFDPCCGSGGMFVLSEEFVSAHQTGNGNGGKAKGDISIFGQESNPIRPSPNKKPLRGCYARSTTRSS
jgi:type I restriction enzyme M protein